MAPNRRGRRSKKVPPGGYRRDAALDAMRDMGFEDELIETTVDELLEVYDGGWLFIEDSSYCVLRDTLLAKSNPTTEPGNPVKERDFDLANGGAVDTENVEWAITIQSSVRNAGAEEEPVAEEVGDEGTNAWKCATVGDLVFSTEVEVGGPVGCPTPTDTEAAGPSSMVLPSSKLKGSCEDGSNAISVEPLSAVPSSKGNDANPFGDGVELHHDKPSESLDEPVPGSKHANRGESSGSIDVDLVEDDQNGSIHHISSSQPPPAPPRRRRRREHKPCYGWLDDDESDEEEYMENHILQLKPAPLPGNFQPSPQRRRVHQEQSKVVSSSDEGGPVGVILPDSELKGSNASAAERAAAVPGSEGNDTKLFSFRGVELQCDKSPKPSGGNELACPLPAQDGESSGSEYVDLEDDDDCFVSEHPIR